MPKDKTSDAQRFAWIAKEISEKQNSRRTKKGNKDFDVHLTPKQEALRTRYEKGELDRKDLPLGKVCKTPAAARVERQEFTR